MMHGGLQKIYPRGTDYHFIPSFAGIIPDPKSLPKSFSIYDGRPIPNQDAPDTRFTPSLDPLWYGCVGETAAFDSGIQDGALYRPDVPYLNTPPYTTTSGRDMRVMLQALIDADVLQKPDGTKGPRRSAYFNCYGQGPIDDFDAARIALYLFQNEKRGVWIGSWWYSEFATPDPDGYLATPSYNTNYASLHAHLGVGFDSTYKDDYIQDLSWQGMGYGKDGVVYFSREEYNALMKQPYTGAFTITKTQPSQIVTIGEQAYLDHLVYFIISVFKNHGLI